LGNDEEANRFADRLLGLETTHEDRWVKAAETFSLIGRDEQVLDVLNRRLANGNDEWSPDLALLYHFAAVAAARTGDVAAARQHWKKAIQLGRAVPIASNNLEDLHKPAGERNGPWGFGLADLVSKSQVEEFARRMKSGKNDDDVQRRAREFLDAHSYWRRLLPLLLDRGDADAREFAVTLASIADTDPLREALKAFAQGRWGSDQLRMRAAQHLAQVGALPSGPIRMWVNGESTEVMLLGFEISSEPMIERRRPARVEKLHQQAWTAMEENRMRKAESLWREALRLDPEAPDLEFNLSVTIRCQGRDSEADEIVGSIHARQPDYLFARTEFALNHLKNKDFAAAETLLAPLRSLRRLHVTEFRALVYAHGELFKAQKNFAAARSWFEMWRAYDPDDEQMNAWGRTLYLNAFERLLPWNG
jgi:tetratricopeptide (TPR) repeat protein